MAAQAVTVAPAQTEEADARKPVEANEHEASTSESVTEQEPGQGPNDRATDETDPVIEPAPEADERALEESEHAAEPVSDDSEPKQDFVAEPTTEPDFAPDASEPEVEPTSGAEQGQEPTPNPEEPAQPEAADEALSADAYASGLLHKKIKDENGHAYSITVTYGEDACIPNGAELHVSLPTSADGQPTDGWASRVEQALALDARDRVLTTTYVNVSIQVDGNVVTPAADVDVTVATNALRPSRSSFVEVVALGDAAHAAQDGADKGIVPQNLTKDQASTHTSKLAFCTKNLGTIALASVATAWDAWVGQDTTVSLLVPRKGLAVSMESAPAPELPEGMDLLACSSVRVDSNPAYGTSLWLEVQPTNEAWGSVTRAADASKAQRQGNVCAYLLHKANGKLGKSLCGPQGTSEPVELRADRDRVLLAWDSGYRNTALTMGDVTVEGMMPTGTRGTATDVTKDYADASALVAYDITLTADGEEYQPDDEHPLTVRIASDAADKALANGEDVQLWHIANDGAAEAIDDYAYEDGAVTFEAPSFSTYLLAAPSDDEPDESSDAEPLTLSSTFRINASARTYARASTITFVDTNKNPIMGTVTGRLDIAYTGGGSESNSTNTIDMFGFIDKLDPAIVDEYEFSRVFVQLTATNQKDFRYIQVGDGTAIATNGDASIYRAYLYMDSIAQNAVGQDYHGTWYQLSNGGDIDNIYLEYYHVAPAEFHALDTRNDPVEGAEFSLYVDPDCYTPLEYKNAEVKATSDKRGLVSFGKIPQGTYYMKETVIPEGFKKSTNIYTVVVDGESEIADVIHDDDDGSVIISDVLRMTLTKEWDDGADKHADDSVEVVVYARGEAICDPIVLSSKNDWTYTLNDLDPNEPYMVSETSVTSNGVDVTSKWIPTITYDELDPHAEYYRADEFKKDKQYVIVTTTSGGTRALVGDTSLTTTPLAANGIQITGNVEDKMLWTVDTITKDSIVALQNAASGKYLDKGSKWNLNSSYPVPLYIRHINNDGVVKFYHRPNLNSATANYLYVWSDGSKEGNVDNYASNANYAASFDLYRKVTVRDVDVTIANKTTRYPVRVKNVDFPSDAPLKGTTFDLYTQEEYRAGASATPYLSGLTAGDEGFLHDGDTVDLELGAGTYYLQQTSYAAGYAHAERPTKFTITRGGALKVAQEDQEFAGFAYASTYQDGAVALPLLQVPNVVHATFEVTMAVEGAQADKTRAFEFELALPDGLSQLSGTIDGEPVVFTEEAATFSLAHGQTLRLEDVPATATYVLTQTKAASYEVRAEVATPDAVAASTQDGDAFVVTLSDLAGTADDPARVAIVNTLPDYLPPATGIADNTIVWGTITLLCVCALAALWLRTKVADRG